MNRLILLRHGQSEWNKKNIFTGWVDIPLSPQGIEEALAAGEFIKNFPIDRVYMSKLIRASMTTMLALSRHSSQRIPAVCHDLSDSPWYSFPESSDLLPVFVSEALNERMYGQLQGKNKQEIKEQFGEEQFLLWRRSFATPPPGGESLQMTAARTLPYFHREILPQLHRGENILISAHGNSLRAIVMEIDKLTPEQVIKLEIPTGQPIVYLFDQGGFRK